MHDSLLDPGLKNIYIKNMIGTSRDYIRERWPNQS